MENYTPEQCDSLYDDQAFNEILPSPPDPPNKITNDLVPDKSTRKVNIPDHKLSR